MHNILSSILSGTWLIDEQSAQGYLPVVASFLKGEHNPFVSDLAENREKNRPYFIDMNAAQPRYIGSYGVDTINELPENSIAIVPIHGIITNDDQFSGPSGSRTKAEIIEKIEASQNVVGVIFDIDSPGGEGAGTRQLSNKIAAMEKPNVGFVRNMIASAGYWIGSACDHIILEDKLTRVGSIGGYMTLADQKRYFENQGINIKKIYARQSKKKNRAVHRDDNTENELQDISEFTQVFIDDVKANRGDKIADDPDIFAGEVYWAQKAIELGLADAMGSFKDAVQYINAQVGQSSTASSNNSNNSNPDNMKIKSTWKNIKSFFGAEKEELKEDDVDQLETSLGEKTEKISSLETEKQKLEEEKKSLEEEKKTLEEAKKNLEEEKKNLEEEKSGLEEKLANMPSGSTAKVKKTQDGNEDEDEIPADPADEELNNML